MKQIKNIRWLCTIRHLCRNCGYQWETTEWITSVPKPTKAEDRIKFKVEQYHCVNI